MLADASVVEESKNSRGNTHARQSLALTGREDHVVPVNQIITMRMSGNVILAAKIDTSA